MSKDLKNPEIETPKEKVLEVKPPKKFDKDKTESTVKIIGVLLTSVTLIFTCLTYQAAQKWKTAEFTSQKFKEFSENQSVKLVNELLDYNSRSVTLPHDKSETTITDDVLYSSLAIDTLNGDFSEVEVKIRDVFDEYFDQLSLFNRYAKAKLITYEQIQPYLDYQAAIVADISNTRKNNDLRHRIWDYINYYGFCDVKELYQQFGYEMK